MDSPENLSIENCQAQSKLQFNWAELALLSLFAAGQPAIRNGFKKASNKEHCFLTFVILVFLSPKQFSENLKNLEDDLTGR
jgi:hypothetical protein